jgi:magnesium transporter
VSIEALLSRGDGTDEKPDLASWSRRELGSNELLWVDLADATEEEIATVSRALHLDDGAGDALREERTSPDARVLEQGIEIVVLSLPDARSRRPVPLQIVLGERWAITRHEEPMPILDDHRERIQDQREVGLLSPVEFLVSVLDWHVDSFFAAAEELEGAVDELDDAALRRDDDLLHELVAMRRRIARVRRTVAAHRELFAELVRPDFLPELKEREAAALERLAVRLDRAAEAVAHVREMLIGTFDVHMTRTAQRTNDIMKVLTLASVILLPASVLAGVMGMNFRVGIFENPTGFWVVIGIMALIAVVTIVIARWRSWL